MRFHLPIAFAGLLLAAACNGKAGEEGPPPPAPPAHGPQAVESTDEAAKIPRTVETVSCDCACERQGCTCRPLRSGACVCVDEEYNDCPCTCEGREIVSLHSMTGQSTEPGLSDSSVREPGSGPPGPPDLDKRGPPAPPSGSPGKMQTPDLAHEGFDLDPD